MWDFQEVINIEYRGHYRYHVAFADGVAGDLDFSEYLIKGPVFEALQDPSLFSKATVDGGTIVWPNGADIAPETLYEKILETYRSHRQSA
jgi:hypothetical protein